VRNRSGLYPRLAVDGQGRKVVSGAGGVLLTRTAATVGLGQALTAALAPWRRPTVRHDPGKVLLDLAISLAMGGDCLADIGQLRAHPQVFGPVASDPTVSRLIGTLAADAPAVLAAIHAARAAARSRAWSLAGKHAADHQTDASRPLVIDVDATLVTAHSEKEQAAPTFKRGFGFHPLCAFLDHGPGAPGSRWRSCCGGATPGPTRSPTTSPCCATPWPNSRAPAAGRGRTCWSASTGPVAPMS
jgi:hypothetical protein